MAGEEKLAKQLEAVSNYNFHPEHMTQYIRQMDHETQERLAETIVFILHSWHQQHDYNDIVASPESVKSLGVALNGARVAWQLNTDPKLVNRIVRF